MNTKLTVIFAILGVAACQQYQSCPDVQSTGTVTSVNIDGCTPGQTCVLTRGTSKSVSIDFTPSQASSTLTMNVYGIIAGIQIKYPGFDTQGCSAAYNINCPLVANTNYEYRNQLSVAQSYPSISLQVKWQLVDSSSNTIGCFLVPVQIQS